MKISVDSFTSLVIGVSPFSMLIIDHGLRTVCMFMKFVECEKLSDIVKKTEAAI